MIIDNCLPGVQCLTECWTILPTNSSAESSRIIEHIGIECVYPCTPWMARKKGNKLIFKTSREIFFLQALGTQHSTLRTINKKLESL
jgi:hypothetical protein